MLIVIGILDAGISLPAWFGAGIFTVSLGSVVYLGAIPINRVNSVCMVGCILAYTLLLLLASGRVRLSSLLSTADWEETMANTPFMVLALSFHNMVPSLPKVMGSKEEVRKAILFGSLLPLAMYVFWEAAILGSLRKGEIILSMHDVVNGLKMVGGEPVVVCFEMFSFLAIITSFLGVGLGCLDFVLDLLFSLNVASVSKFLKQPVGRSSFVDSGRLAPLALLLAPCYLIAVGFPQIFLSALEVSGTLRLFVFSIMPAVMVWIGRRDSNRTPHTFGGRGLLIAVLVMSLSIIVIEVL